MTGHGWHIVGPRRQFLAVATAIALCAPAPPAAAQSATAPVLTAAFLFSFAKFTEWPREVLRPGQDLSLCVVGDAAVRDALEQTIEGHAIDGHQLTVRMLKPDSSAASCHLLYVGATEAGRSTALLTSARTASIFTVSDAARFAETGGVAELVRENDRMRFTINLAVARRVRLTLSSRLLTLAKVIEE